MAHHLLFAGVAELADAPDLGSGAARRGGSSPFTRTFNEFPLDLSRINTEVRTFCSNMEVASDRIQSCRGGGTGRRTGLKILR